MTYISQHITILGNYFIKEQKYTWHKRQSVKIYEKGKHLWHSSNLKVHNLGVSVVPALEYCMNIIAVVFQELQNYRHSVTMHINRENTENQSINEDTENVYNS